MNTLRALPILLFLTAASAFAATDSGQWKYSVGADYSSGDYGGDPVDTEITYLPFTAAYSTGLWKFKATVPWVEIKGAGTVIGAGDGGVVVGRGGGTTSSTESGLGDIWLGATYSVASFPSELFYLDLGAKVKVPTADEDKGLGTGEMDYSLQADIFKPLGNNTPFATFAYKIKGDPGGIDLDNVIRISVGNDFGLSEQTHLGVSLDYQEATTSASDDSLELFGYINQKLDAKWGLMLYGYKGLQDGSPDYGLGIQLSYKP